MRRFAATTAILGFLGLAGVGLASGVPPFDCALRALAGAAGLYVLARIVGRIVLQIMIDVLVDSAAGRAEGEEKRP